MLCLWMHRMPLKHLKYICRFRHMRRKLNADLNAYPCWWSAHCREKSCNKLNKSYNKNKMKTKGGYFISLFKFYFCIIFLLFLMKKYYQTFLRVYTKRSKFLFYSLQISRPLFRIFIRNVSLHFICNIHYHFMLFLLHWF